MIVFKMINNKVFIVIGIKGKLYKMSLKSVKNKMFMLIYVVVLNVLSVFIMNVVMDSIS